MIRPLRDSIETVRVETLELHRVLISACRIEYERDHGPVPNPSELLRLLTTHAAFTWLRPLSNLILAFDDLLAMPSVDETDAKAVRVELEELLARGADGFPDRYRALMQSTPDVIIAHAAVQRALAALPSSKPEEVATLRSVRQRWVPPRRRPAKRDGS